MFKIQLSNPVVLRLDSSESENIEGLIEDVFPLETEYAFIIWNNIFIPVSYKYDISYMVLDFIKIVDFIKDEQEEFLEIDWPSDTFMSTWNLKKKAKVIVINSEWRYVLGGVKDLLNQKEQIVIDAKDFELEIKHLLSFLRKSIDESGLNTSEIKDFDKLNNCLSPV